jgi:hypothetical protein
MDYEFSHLTDSLNTANPETIAQYVKTELEIRIENALGIGKENAIKMRELQLKIGAKSNRKVRLAIENMRLHNVIVLSDSTHGYWIEDSFSECSDWLDFMTSYIADISHLVKVVKIHAENKYHRQYQLPLFML